MNSRRMFWRTLFKAAKPEEDRDEGWLPPRRVAATVAKGGAMRLKEILETYSDDQLDRLSDDKVDSVSSLRLPRQVIVQEIVSALSSLSYVVRVLAPTRPPAFAFLKLIMEAPDRRLSMAGFRHRVQQRTDLLTERAGDSKGLSSSKQYNLYPSRW